jgi:uncharacterized membrane protein
MDNAILVVSMRYLHIVGAVIAVGGTTFILACLLPSLKLVEENLRQSLLKMTTGRFLKWLYASIAMLLISGIFNWVNLASAYRAMGPIGNALIGTKVLLAIVLFAIIGAQAAGVIAPANPKRLLVVNLHLAAIVILLGSILRYLRMTAVV